MAEKKFLELLAEKIRAKHYSHKTEYVYVQWARRFILFHHKRHPQEMGAKEVEQYLSYLANTAHVSASTQNQALEAIKFMYREMLDTQTDTWNTLRAKEGKRLPTVLNREDTRRVLDLVEGEMFNLMARLLYGAGLRLKECQALRFKDIEFSSAIIMVRGGKGQMAIARRLHEIDVQRGMPGVYVPDALDKKYPNIGQDLGWFWVFPAQNYSVDPASKIRRRHYQHESELQRAVRAAGIKAGVLARVSPHTFRHCFATHLLWAGYDIRTVQDLMGHESVKTTMIYLHILNPGSWKGVESPLDKMSAESVISR
jgi:site-specific recombinase XerD